MKKTQQKTTLAPLIVLDDLMRPVEDLIAEMDAAASDFESVSMILSRTETDTVHFVWHKADYASVVSEVEALVTEGCVPVGLLAVRETPEGWRRSPNRSRSTPFDRGLNVTCRASCKKCSKPTTGRWPRR